jgi:hypothetical protein
MDNRASVPAKRNREPVCGLSLESFKDVWIRVSRVRGPAYLIPETATQCAVEMPLVRYVLVRTSPLKA